MSDHVTGPYRTDPRSPLLTHRHLGADASIQNVGHADIVDDTRGRSWAVVLGIRPIDGHHNLGRETFLVKVRWEEAGPVFAPGIGRIRELDLDVARTPNALEWVSLRGPLSVTRNGADVAMSSSPAELTASGTPSFLAVRQCSHRMVLQCRLDAQEIGSARVGIAAFQNKGPHLRAELRRVDEGLRLEVVQTSGGSAVVLAERSVGVSAVVLRIRAMPRSYAIEIEGGHGTEIVAEIPHAALSTQPAGGFVGVLLGLLEVGRGDLPAVVFRDVLADTYLPRTLRANVPDENNAR